MQSGNDYQGAVDYAGTGETSTGSDERSNADVARQSGPDPTILVELVVVDGAEGQKLHSIQAEVVRRILARLAERYVRSHRKRVAYDYPRPP